MMNTRISSLCQLIVTVFLSCLVLLPGSRLHALDILSEDDVCGRGKTMILAAASTNPLTAEQQKVDIGYYGCRFNIFPESNTFQASTVISTIVLDSSLQYIQLDFHNHTAYSMTVQATLLDGDTASFTHANHHLTIPLDTPRRSGDTLEVQVFYQAGPMPASDNQAFNFDSHNGNTSIWTFSQPFSAREWWPCIDQPGDKADSMDIIITVPSGLTAVSNGKLLSKTDAGDGRSTFHWREQYPISTYLVSLAIYPYFIWGETYVTASNDTLPIEFYTFTDTVTPEPSYLVENYRKVLPMLDVFEGFFGPYPFPDEKYGHAEWGMSWGMEHQTITSMGVPTERRVAHELAHMWWGDMITLDSYHDMWINEGFATYAEALWFGAIGGEPAYHNRMRDLAYYGWGTVYVENPLTDYVFTYSLSYAKAAWILHMLRHVVGDATFFDILLEYGDDPNLKYGTVTTEQFKDLCERLSGIDLDAFFQQWVHGNYHPVYAYSWQQELDSVTVTIRQTQSTGTVYEMPIDLRFLGSDTMFTHVVQNSMPEQQYRIHLPEGTSLRSILLDPDNWILKEAVYLDTDEIATTPGSFELYPLYPNPFNVGTTISFSVPETQPVQLAIYNLQGRLVWTHGEVYQPGIHHIGWRGTDQYNQILGSGIYIIRLSTSQTALVKKAVLVK